LLLAKSYIYATVADRILLSREAKVTTFTFPEMGCGCCAGMPLAESSATTYTSIGERRIGHPDARLHINDSKLGTAWAADVHVLTKNVAGQAVREPAGAEG
ncbi:MAG: hypothetical protein ABR885_10210, partial [Mycobacterium sp.]